MQQRGGGGGRGKKKCSLGEFKTVTTAFYFISSAVTVCFPVTVISFKKKELIKNLKEKQKKLDENRRE